MQDSSKASTATKTSKCYFPENLGEGFRWDRPSVMGNLRASSALAQVPQYGIPRLPTPTTSQNTLPTPSRDATKLLGRVT